MKTNIPPNRRIGLALALCLFFPILSIYADDFLGTRSSEFYGKTYDFNLSAKALAAAPRWKKGEAFPPLSPLKAREIAFRMAKKLCPSVTAWGADSIILEEIHQTYNDAPATYWIYLVPCEDIGSDVIGKPFQLNIPVMMNGIAIEPLINAKVKDGQPY
jgi:hypothetical protein